MHLTSPNDHSVLLSPLSQISSEERNDQAHSPPYLVSYRLFNVVANDSRTVDFTLRLLSVSVALKLAIESACEWCQLQSQGRPELYLNPPFLLLPRASQAFTLVLKVLGGIRALLISTFASMAPWPSLRIIRTTWFTDT